LRQVGRGHGGLGLSGRLFARGDSCFLNRSPTAGGQHDQTKRDAKEPFDGCMWHGISLFPFFKFELSGSCGGRAEKPQFPDFQFYYTTFRLSCKDALATIARNPLTFYDENH
jgi:hypothetical protein